MKFNLKNKKEILPTLLGNIDLLDISYYMQQQNESGVGVSGTSNLLLCFNPSLLNILYKFDQWNANYEVDWTDAGDNVCNVVDVEFVTDNVVKLEIEQDFIRSFSFKKSQYGSASAYSDDRIVNYLSLDPSMFLDYENTEILKILTESERNNVLQSKLIGVTINNQTLSAKSQGNASRGAKLPKNILFFSVLNNKLSYNTETSNVTDLRGNSIEVPVYVDSNLAEDAYQKNNKAFTVVNDSTISLKFLMYIDVGEFNYIIDKNDLNVNYHINVSGTKTIQPTGNYDLTIYEKITLDYMPVNKIVYIKNIYNDEIVAVAKVMNIVNNTVTLNSLYSKYGTLEINNMDEFILVKTFDLTNFKNKQSMNIINSLISSNLLCLNDIIFSDNDFKLLDSLF